MKSREILPASRRSELPTARILPQVLLSQGWEGLLGSSEPEFVRWDRFGTELWNSQALPRVLRSTWMSRAGERRGLGRRFLLPVRIKARAFCRDAADVVPSLGEQHGRDFPQGGAVGAPSATVGRHDPMERETTQRHLSVFLGETIPRELDRRGDSQGREALDVIEEPAAVLSRSAGVAQLRCPTTQGKRIQDVAQEVVEFRRRLLLLGQREGGAAKLLKQRLDFVVAEVGAPRPAHLAGRVAVMREPDN